MLRTLPVAFVAVLFFAPLAYFGELGTWTFDEPVSNLEWDEAMRPQQSGGTEAGGSGGGTNQGSGSSGSETGGGSGNAEGRGSGSGEGGSTGGSGDGGSSGSGGSGGSSGGSGNPFAAFGSFAALFAGMASAGLAFGFMFAFWAQAFAAFMQAFMAMMATWMWAVMMLLWLALLYQFGIYAGIVLGTGGVVMFVLYQNGLIFQPKLT